MHSLSIFGTSSDAGKSTLAFSLTYLLHKEGIKVAPFKAQNVSNNSLVTDIDTGEIAIPQAFAAQAINLPTTPLFNPILLKSGGANSAHIIINGKSIGNKDVWNYYRDMQKLKPVVKKALKTLQKEYECIVAEGAGSPVELNLMDKDLSNLYVAKKLGSKIVLVADIERGGVFASIYGVYKLLPKKLRKNVIGVIINKFRGDMRLFEDGIKIIQKRFSIPVLGVIPYKPFNLGFEDSASLMHYSQDTTKAIIRVGVIHFPYISNFTDFEPLVVDEQIELSFIKTPQEASNCDVLILPGSKRVVDDLVWLKRTGLAKHFVTTQQPRIAICGGYEMLFEKIHDPLHVESNTTLTQGLGIFKGKVIFEKKKIVQKGIYNIFGVMGEAYEIHNAQTKKRSKRKQNIYGTFLHGIFDNDNVRYKIFSKIDSRYKGYEFQAFKAKSIDEYALHVKEHIDFSKILHALTH